MKVTSLTFIFNLPLLCMEVKRRDLGKGRDNGNFKAGKFEMYFGVINEDLLIKHP